MSRNGQRQHVQANRMESRIVVPPLPLRCEWCPPGNHPRAGPALGDTIGKQSRRGKSKQSHG